MKSKNKSTTCNLDLSNCYHMENNFHPWGIQKWEVSVSSAGDSRKKNLSRKTTWVQMREKQLQWPIRCCSKNQGWGLWTGCARWKKPRECLLSKMSISYFRFLTCCSVSRYPSAVHHSLRLKVPSSCSNAVMSLCKKTVPCPQVKSSLYKGEVSKESFQQIYS